MNRGALLVVTIAVLAGLAAWWIQDEEAAQDLTAVRLGSVLGDGDAGGFRRADPAYRLEFPADHGSHPDFRSEWWYFTGNLGGEDGERYGFHFTIFRFGLAPESRRRLMPQRKF